MNYLWEVMIQAGKQGISEEQLRFGIAGLYSAYMEIANTCINQNSLEQEQVIEVNPYYRFYEIFKDLYQPDLNQWNALRDSITNLILHELAENDVLSGMTKEEFCKKLLLKDFRQDVFGCDAREAMELFTIDEQQTVMSGMLRQYQTGCCMDLFQSMMETLIPDNIVYHNNHKPREILIYVGREKEETLEKKIMFLVHMFLNLISNVNVYYEYHFGIIGIEGTMVIDEIALC